MKKHWILSIFLTIALCVICFVLCPTEAKAAGAGDLTFTLNEDGASYTVESCDTLASGMMVIPSTYNGLPVTGIGLTAFRFCSSLTDIIIPDSVTIIYTTSFDGCKNLTGVWVSDNHPKYSNDDYGVLFNKDKTTLLSAPNGLAGSYTIPNSVTTINNVAFNECHNLLIVNVPSSVTSIGPGAFDFCNSLLGIFVKQDNAKYSSDANGVLFNKNMTKLIAAPGALGGIYTIPDGVTEIDVLAFDCCIGLTKINIPGSVKTIGKLAFYGCDGLTWVNIPNGVTSIGDYAFYWCSNVTTITLPKSLTTIGKWAISGCGNLTNVYYAGTKRQFAQIKIGENNDSLTSADIHFASANVAKITTQPKTAKVKSGATAKFTVKATGDGLKYQWQSSTNGKTWKNCTSSTAKKATFTFTAKTSHSSNYYRCVITDANGDKVYTDAVRLYVLGVTKQPTTQKVAAGKTVKYTVTATGASKTYQWQSSTDGKTWKNCSSSSATKATFTFTAKTSHSSNYYRCRIKDNAGNTVYTDVVRLYVLGITTQPTAKTVKPGATAKFTVKATGAGKTYQWQCSTDGGKTWKNCSSSSATKDTFTFTGKTSHNGNYYRCRVKDNGGNRVYTTKVKLTVKK